MKTQILTTLAALFFMTTMVNAQIDDTQTAEAPSNSKFATARIIESATLSLCKINVVYGDEESEVIPLETYRYVTKSPRLNSIFHENQKTINTFLNDMDKKGYEILNITSSGEEFFHILILFKKKEE